MDAIDPDLFRSQCVLTKARKASRAVSRHFGTLVRPHGISASQASLLFGLYGSDATSVSELAAGMGIERSGMTRNLAVLEKAGLVACDVAGRGGAKAYRLTTEGEAKLMGMLPLWHEAQAQVREQLGEEEWARMQATLARLAEL
ncbi:MAG: MarR family winged helix-turn-helix transcriptional regulator [Pseudomonadota bacterium]